MNGKREVRDRDGTAEAAFLERLLAAVNKGSERKSDHTKRGMCAARQRRLAEQRGSRRKGAQKVYGYARTSGEVTAGSVMEQIRALLNPNAAGSPPTLIAIDVGCRGVSTDRPGLRHLLRAAERGLVKKVVVSDRSRLARSPKDIDGLLRRFNRLGVPVEVNN